MIVGISGKARSGKDTFANYLHSGFLSEGIICVQRAFAEELKKMCSSLFDLSYKQLWGNEKERNDLRYAKCLYGLSSNPADYWTSREIMQEMGSFFRKIDYDFWVKKLDESIKAEKRDNKYNTKCWIITDVRHLNEAWYVKQNGFLINIVRKNADEIHGMTHESETALDNYTDYDMVINNDGTLEDLQNATKDAVNLILKLENLKGEQKNG